MEFLVHISVNKDRMSLLFWSCYLKHSTAQHSKAKQSTLPLPFLCCSDQRQLPMLLDCWPLQLPTQRLRAQWYAVFTLCMTQEFICIVRMKSSSNTQDKISMAFINFEASKYSASSRKKHSEPRLKLQQIIACNYSYTSSTTNSHTAASTCYSPLGTSISY